jgi:hypothetical protein
MMKKVSLILFSLLFVVGSYLSTQTFAGERGDRKCVRRCNEHYEGARRRCNQLNGEARERCLREINEHLRDCLRRCQ